MPYFRIRAWTVLEGWAATANLTTHRWLPLLPWAAQPLTGRAAG